MVYKPHAYQQYAIDYLKQNPVAALLIQMGLGKTSCTLTALNELIFDSFEVHKVLVVAPLRVARDTWPEEIEKWDHLKNLQYAVAVGTPAERIAALQQKADITIINRENIPWLIEESGIPFEYDTLVIDELSSFKNPSAKRFRSLLKVRPRLKRIIGLTGTPSANGLMDLWAEFRLLDGGQRLGRSLSEYRLKYFVPERWNGDVVYSYKPKPGAEEAIYAKIADITISMNSTDYLKMPELVSTEYTVRLSEKEAQQYEAMKRELILSLPEGDATAANFGALANKLSQMANGAIYIDDGSIIPLHARKLDALEDILEAAAGHPVLVAYWFQHDLQRIEERLRKLKVPYAKLDSPESIRAWNSGTLPVGLIHPASAGHGLNLQSGGSSLVWFGLPWSLELYQQTNARLWRQGQQAETVVIQHIIAKGTVDEQILMVLKSKDETQSALLNAVRAEVKGD